MILQNSASCRHLVVAGPRPVDRLHDEEGEEEAGNDHGRHHQALPGSQAVRLVNIVPAAVRPAVTAHRADLERGVVRSGRAEEHGGRDGDPGVSVLQAELPLALLTVAALI